MKFRYQKLTEKLHGLRYFGVGIFVFIFTFISIFPSSTAFSATGVPEIITFQGRLMNSSGTLLGSSSGTNYCYRFSLYDDPTVGSGTKLWPVGVPTTMTLLTRSGVFDAQIGGTGGDVLNYNFQDNDTVYVNVEVAAQVAGSCAGVVFETLDPRPQIASAAYAINAGTVLGFTPSQTPTGSQIPVLNSGDLNLAGDIVTDGLTLSGFAGGGNQCLQVNNAGLVMVTGSSCGAGGGGFDSTTIDSTTWSDGANASNTWTFDVSGTDTTITFGSGLVTFSHAVTATGTLSTPLLNLTGTGTINGLDAIDATTEATLEAALDLQDISGAVTDAQVPNNITITLAATATALVANGGNCSAGSGAGGVDASGVAEDCTDYEAELNDSAGLLAALSDETGTGLAVFSNSPTFTDDFDLAAAGVRLTGADGVLTLLGLGNGNDEDLSIDFDNAAANTVAVTSSTGVTSVTFGGIALTTNTLTLTGTGTLNGLDAIDATTEATLEAALDLQDLQGAVTDAQVPNNITIDLATLASTETVVDGTDATSFVAIFDSATGSLAVKTDGALLYNASNGTLTATTFSGAFSGNATTATALAANGGNCSAGSGAGGVDASGVAEDCTDYEAELNDSAGLLAALSDETGTGLAVFNDSPTFVDDFNLAAAGIKFTGADGVLTLLGLGNGNDEDLSFDFDNAAANVVAVASSTGVTSITFGSIGISTDTLTLTGTGTLNGLDAIDATTEATLEAALDLQDLQGAVTDAQVPNNITITLAATATALAANGGNCSAGSGAGGVDASGVAEDCTDYEAELNDSAGLLAALSDETGTGLAVFNDSPTFADDFNLAAAGIKFTGADGVLTLLGQGNGNDENLTFDFDNGTANQVDIASGTGVTQINYTAIGASFGANVGIGDTSPDYTLELANNTTTPIFALSDDDVSQPATDFLQADVFGGLTSISTTAGGLQALGISDGDASGLYLAGAIGASNPTDTTPAIGLFANKSDGGTSLTALGAFETVLQIANFATPLFTILGSGNTGIGTTTIGDVKLSVLNSALDGTGLPASSGTTAVGNLRLNDNSNIALDFGTVNSGAFPAWLQVHDSTDQSVNYPLILNPNGGGVGVGVSPTSTFSVSGTANVTTSLTTPEIFSDSPFDYLLLHPVTDAQSGFAQLQVTVPAGLVDDSALALVLSSRTESSNDYFNPVLRFAAYNPDASPEIASTFEIGSEGNYLDNGTFSQGRFYLYDFINDQTIFFIDQTNPNLFIFQPGIGVLADNYFANTLVKSPNILGGSAAGSTLSLQSTDGVGTTDAILFKVGNNGGTEALRIVDSGRVGIGSTAPEALLEVQGVEATDAVIALDADDGDDAADTWFLKSVASGNAFTFTNDATEVASLSTAGALQLDSLAGGGAKCLHTDNNGLITVAAADCGTSGSTAWNDIGDATADGTIALAGFETDFTSTLDSAGKAIITITNTDADTAADTDFISLAHNDGADANIFYFRAVGDLDGTPQTDYRFSQTAALIRPDLTVTGSVTASSFVGPLTGNASTATALAANGGNCSAGSGAGGVDASGVAEDCTDYEAELNDSAGLLAALSDETGTGLAVFNDSPTFADDFSLAAAGVKFTGADGVLTLLGLGNGNDENLTFDFDNGTANQVDVASGTGVTQINYTSIGASFGANVGVGDTSPDYTLELYDATNTPKFALSDDDVAQPATDFAQADVFALLESNSTTNGGLKLSAYSDTDATALLLAGAIGSTDPTDTRAAISFLGAKSDGGTSLAALGSSETVFQISNFITPLVTVLGNGNVGIGAVDPEALLEVQGAEATDASIALDADDGDDPEDTWFIKSLATGNALSFENDSTQVAKISSGGALQLDSLISGGTQCLQADASGNVTGTGSTCGTGGGGISSLTLAGTSGSNQTLNDGDTITIAAGNSITTTGGATDTVTVGVTNDSITDTQLAFNTGQHLTTASSPSFDDLTLTGSDISIGAAGVKLTGDGDGALTFLGLGNGSDEDFTLNFDDTSNTVVASSSTGVTLFDFGTIDVSTNTLTLTGTGTLNGLDAIDATTEATLEAALDLQDLQGAVTDAQVPNNITIDLATLASTETVVDGTDATSFVAIFDSATGSLAVKTDGALLYNASNGTLTATTFSGAFSGNATTATALAANGGNCSAGSGAGGVDASGVAEDCTDYEAELNDSAGLLAALSDETGTGLAVFNDSPTFVDDFNLAAAGVKFTGADGVLTLLGQGNGNDENLTFDFDNGTANNVDISTGTGVTQINFGAIALTTNTLTLTGTGTLNGLDAIDATTEATLEAALDLQDLQGAVTDAQVPNNITIDLATLASTVTVVDSTDATSFVAIFDSATGSLPAKTDAGLTYNATTAALTATTFVGALTGNASTATALAGNGGNCSAGSGAGGVDASGVAEDCTDYEAELNDSAGLLAALSDETGTGLAVFNDSPTFVDDFNLAAAGIKFTGADGVLTLLGLGNGNDENLTFDFDNAAANVVAVASGTGVTSITFGSIGISTDTLTLTGTGTLNGLDAIDATTEATLEAALDLQDLQGAVTDAQVPNNITIDLATLASTETVVDGTDATSFVAIFDSATGSLAVKTDGALLYNASNGTLTATTFSGAFSGNATTATALAANGGNCSAGSGAGGVDASGVAEDCTDYEAELNDSAGLLAALSDETGTGLAVFNDSPTFADDISLAAAGVKLTGADGVLTLLGQGNGNDENLTIDLDNGTANQVDIASGTGVTQVNYSSIGASFGGNVGIGDTSPDYTLELADNTNSPIFVLSDDDVNQPATDSGQADAFGILTSISTTAGGLTIAGGSDTDAPGLYLAGFIGSTDPTDTTPAISLYADKSDGGTGFAALGATETVLQVFNLGTPLLTILGNGNVGIGTISPDASLGVEITSTATSGQVVGVSSSVIANPSGTSTAFYGNSFSTFVDGSNTEDINGALAGIVGNVSSGYSSGILAYAAGVSGSINKGDIGPITNAYGLSADINNLNATGDITNAYGVYVQPFDRTGAITNSWGVYVEDTVANNYFGGSVGIGNAGATPEALLEVQGAEATDAVIALDADDGDDAADTWFLKSIASGNAFTFTNNATEVASLSSAGALQLDSLAGGGAKCLHTDNNGLITASAADCGGTNWNDIGDATADGTIALAGFETDFTSTLDSAGKAIFTITNTDADTAADTDFISLAHNDGADANIFYFRAVGDLDGTPQTDYLFSQTAALIRPDLTLTNGLAVGGAITEAGNAVPNATDTLAFFSATTSAQLAGVLSDETGSSSGVAVFSNSPTFTDDFDLAAAGVRLTGADGVLTLLGIGNGNDEDLSFDFDNVASNVVAVASSTGVTSITFGSIGISTDTLTLTGTGTLNGLDAIDATTEATLEAALDLQDLQGAVTDAQVPNNITIDLATLASTETVVDGTDATSFVAIFDSATGSLAVKTDGALLYNASNGTLTATTFSGAFSGNATTATALAANGGNCSAGSGAGGVDASGVAEDCTDYEAELNDSAGLLAALSDETGTGLAVFNDSPTFADDISLAAAGVKLTGADGVLTLLGQGNGNDENLTFDFDNGTANQVDIASGTGVTQLNFTSIGASFGANVGIGDTSPDYTLELADNTNSPIFALSDDDVVQPFSLAQADAFGIFSSISTTAGGAQLTGISDTDAVGLALVGAIGSTDPTDTTTAIRLTGFKSDGGGSVAALGATETVLQVSNLGTPLVTLLGSGNFGIGETEPEAKLHVAATSTETADTDVFGSILTLEVDPSATSDTGFANLITTSTVAGNAEDITGALVGLNTYVSHSGTGIVDEATGILAGVANADDGDIDVAKGIEVGVLNFGDGDITNAYALYIDDFFNAGAGTISNKWGIYQNDASANNYFAGNVGIGTDDPLNSLHVQNAGTSQIRVSDATGAFYFDFGRDNADGYFKYDGNQGGYKWFNGGTEAVRIDNSGNVGIGSNSPEALLEVQGVEATDAVIALDADDGDDAADTWFLKSVASGNAFTFTNNATEVASLSTAGALQLDSLAGGGTKCLHTDNNGLITAAAADCGGGSFDSTAVDATTWSDGANASNTWTFDVSGTDTTATFGNNNWVFGVGSIDLGAAGVRATQDGDGALTLLGLGNGNDEDLKINLDDGAGGANTIEFTSSTGVTQIDFTSIGATFGANVGVGDTTPDYALEISDSTNTPTFALSDDDISHPFTTFAQADVFGGLTSISTTAGGLAVSGYSDSDATGLQLAGAIGSTDPTDTKAAVTIIGAKSDGGTSFAALGNSETVFQVSNLSTPVFTLLGNGFTGIGDSTPDALLNVEGTTTASGTTAIAGILTELTLSNGTGSGTQFGNRSLVTVSGGTAGTEIGDFIRVTDSTALANTTRGLEVQAWSGTNTLGTNTGIAAYGKTFGISATTDALAGGVSSPAAIFADLDNGSATTSGNAIRAYTDNATSANLVSFYQETSAYTGTGLIMNFGNSGGSFVGNFLDLQKAGTSKFSINEKGRVDIKVADADNAVPLYINSEESTTSSMLFQIESDANTADSVKFSVSAEGIVNLNLNGTATTNGLCQSGSDIDAASNTQADVVACSAAPGDIAEWYETESNVEVGDVVMTTAQTFTYTEPVFDPKTGLDTGTTSTNKISVLAKGTTSAGTIIGVVSTSPYQAFGKAIISSGAQNPQPVALAGRVPVKVSDENGLVQAGDRLSISPTMPGYAVKMIDSGLSIGIAINDATSPTDKVMAFINLGYQFNGLSFASSTQLFNTGFSFGGEVEFTVPPLFNSDTGGFALIKSGDRRVKIEFDESYVATPVVSATMTFEEGDNITDVEAAALFSENIQYIVVDKSEDGFTILINKNAPRDLRFSWTALAIRNPNIFESIFEGLTFTPPTPPPTPTPSPSPTPTPSPSPTPTPPPAGGPGCTDQNATNYDPLATVDDGSCVAGNPTPPPAPSPSPTPTPPSPPPAGGSVPGCTDSSATNYDPAATVDDGSCVVGNPTPPPTPTPPPPTPAPAPTPTPPPPAPSPSPSPTPSPTPPPLTP